MAIVLATTGFLSGCGGSDDPMTPAGPFAVSVDLTMDGSTTVLVGNTVRATATVTFDDGSVRTSGIEWNSTNQSVATVDQNGTISAIAQGSTQIVAVHPAEVGNVADDVTISVPAPDGTVGSGGGVVADGGSRTLLEIPAGSLSGETAITIEPAPLPGVGLPNNPPDGEVVAGTAFEFGPEGTSFASQAVLTLGFNPANVGNLSQAGLRVVRASGSSWVDVGNSQVDLQAATVTAPISSFSTFALVGQPNAAPVPTISQPASGSTFPQGSEVVFEGTANDAEEGELPGSALEWTSDRDGVLGTGAQLAISTLSIGQHTITLTATDIDGAEGTTQIQITVEATEPPSITRYQVDLSDPSTCPDGSQDARFLDEVDYLDPDGDFPFNADLSEGQSEPIVDSEFRQQGGGSFSDFPFDKGWQALAGSDGSTGTLRQQLATCVGTSATTLFFDFRVRLRDTAGNWSGFTEVRVPMPNASVADVTPTPSDPSVISPGTPIVITAEARDDVGEMVPFASFGWANYNAGTMGAVSQQGVYTPTGDAAGLDNVYVQSGREGARVILFTEDGRDAPDAWFAPDVRWNGLARAQGVFQHYRMRVEQGTSYTFNTLPDGSGTTAGDPDLFLRFGQRPTPSDFDERSVSATANEVIQWTAPDDGVVFFSVHGFTAYQGVAVSAVAEGGCDFPSSTQNPPCVPPPATAVPADWDPSVPIPLDGAVLIGMPEVENVAVSVGR